MGEIHVMREGFLPPKQPPRRHLISIGDLEREDVERLLATAKSFSRSLEREVKKLPTLRGRTVVNVFYESSTRTSSSFELAAKRLSADTMSIKAAGSSVDKGESLKDTALTLGAYDPDVIVIRHPQIGAPQLVARYTDAHVVNAGDGKHQHPTQALLDLYTIQDELGRIEGVHVAIVGDVLHSRVARSNVQALALMGAKVTLVGPPPLIPRGIEAMGCEVSHEIGAIADADVVYVLRMQRERMAEGANYVPSLREYTERWGVTPERIRAGPEGDASRPDEPRRRDRPAGRGRRRRADRGAGARRPRRPDGGALRPAHDRPGAGRGGRAAGGGLMLYGKNGRKDDLVVRGARVLDPVEGVDAVLDVRVDKGVIAALGEGLDANGHRVVDGAGLVLAPAFVDPHVHLRVPGGEDEETIASGTEAAAAGGYCAILAMPNTDPVVDSAAVLGSLIEDAQGAGGDPGRVPRRDHARPGRRRADRDGRARRPGRGRLHRRRPPGRRAGPDAPRAPVPRHHRPPARAALRGADALEGRPDARGRGLGGARLHRLPVGRREPDGRARPLARRLRGGAAAPAAPLGARVGRARCGRHRPRASRRPPRSRRTTSA